MILPIQNVQKPENLIEVTNKNPDGTSEHYFKDKADRIQGIYQRFFKGKRIAEEATFIDNMREGKTVLYYDQPNSPVWKVLNYENNVLHGNCFEHTYNPHVCKITTYAAGKQVPTPRIKYVASHRRIPAGPGINDYGRIK